MGVFLFIPDAMFSLKYLRTAAADGRPHALYCHAKISQEINVQPEAEESAPPSSRHTPETLSYVASQQANAQTGCEVRGHRSGDRRNVINLLYGRESESRGDENS